MRGRSVVGWARRRTGRADRVAAAGKLAAQRGDLLAERGPLRFDNLRQPALGVVKHRPRR